MAAIANEVDGGRGEGNMTGLIASLRQCEWGLFREKWPYFCESERERKEGREHAQIFREMAALHFPLAILCIVRHPIPPRRRRRRRRRFR